MVVLGLDVGGTKTTCLVADDARIEGRGTAGTGNPSIVGLDGFASAITQAADLALLDARTKGLDLGGTHPARAWLGVAGAASPELLARLQEVSARVLQADEVCVSDDATLVLPAAGLTQGVALVAGTGSFATASGPGGRTASVGGWGHLFGDEGSGYELGRLALRAVTHAADGRGPRTTLSGTLLGAFGVAEPADLIARLYPAPAPSVIADLARHVLDAATMGDVVAQALLADAATALAAMIRACARNVGLIGPGAPERTIDVVVVGGLATPSGPLVTALERALDEHVWRVRRLEVEPAMGAVVLAARGPCSTIGGPRAVAPHVQT